MSHVRGGAAEAVRRARPWVMRARYCGAVLALIFASSVPSWAATPTTKKAIKKTAKSTTKAATKTATKTTGKSAAKVIVVKRGQAQVRAAVPEGEVASSQPDASVAAGDAPSQSSAPAGQTGPVTNQAASAAAAAPAGTQPSATATAPRSVATAATAATAPTTPATRTVPIPEKRATVISPGTWLGIFSFDGAQGAYPVQLEITAVNPTDSGGVTFQGTETVFCADIAIDGSIDASGKAEFRELSATSNSCTSIDTTGVYKGAFNAADGSLQMQWKSASPKSVGGILDLRHTRPR